MKTFLQINVAKEEFLNQEASAVAKLKESGVIVIPGFFSEKTINL